MNDKYLVGFEINFLILKPSEYLSIDNEVNSLYIFIKSSCENTSEKDLDFELYPSWDLLTSALSIDLFFTNTP
jgi:hypothetical protein